MADRYQDKPFPADDQDRGGPRAPAKGDSDPLAELARLIGQTDPFATLGRANQPAPPRSSAQAEDQHTESTDDGAPAGPPPWMRRAAAPPQAPQQDFPSAVHPLQRHAAANAAAEPEYHQAPPFAADEDQHYQADPARYDDALYGQPDPAAQPAGQDPAAYAEDPYAYQDGYGDEPEGKVQKRRGGMVTVAAVLLLAMVGTGGAYAYRTYMGTARSGEPPIIKAETGPNKIVPAPSGDGSSKVMDRMAAGGGAEKIVPREEQPVDVSKAGPRVVFPPLNQNAANPPTATVVAPLQPAAASGALPNNEPRKIKTLAVKGDPADVAAVPAPKPSSTVRAPAPSAAAAARAPTPSAANANASSANAPLSLSPQAAPAAAEPRTRVATTSPAPTGGGGYVVQVSSQKNEADAQASYRALQGKFPSVLGSRAPLIKRADLGDKGVYYRAMVGPFGSPDEATQFCGSLKTAGGQCVVQKN